MADGVMEAMDRLGLSRKVGSRSGGVVFGLRHGVPDLHVGVASISERRHIGEATTIGMRG
jgi:hypothetical protein